MLCTAIALAVFFAAGLSPALAASTDLPQCLAAVDAADSVNEAFHCGEVAQESAVLAMSAKDTATYWSDRQGEAVFLIFAANGNLDFDKPKAAAIYASALQLLQSVPKRFRSQHSVHFIEVVKATLAARAAGQPPWVDAH